MNASSEDQSLALHNTTNQAEFERLHRFIHAHIGRFTLGLIRVNSPLLRNEITNNLAKVLKQEQVIQVTINLENRVAYDLREAIKSDLGYKELKRISEKLPDILQRIVIAVVGIEHLVEDENENHPSSLHSFPQALNLEREAVKETFPTPMLFFLTDHAMDRLDLLAPDFFDWYSALFQFYLSSSTIQPVPTLHNYFTELEELERKRRELVAAGTPFREELAHLLKKIGNLYTSLNDRANRQSAVSYFKQSASIFHELRKNKEEADVLQSFGDVCYAIDDHPQAERRFKSALEIYKQQQDTLNEALCLQKLGDVYYMLDEENQMRNARSFFRDAKFAFRRVGGTRGRLGEAECIAWLGELHVRLNEYDDAQKLFQEALQIFEKIEDGSDSERGRATCLEGLADVKRQIAQYEAAQIFYMQASEIYEAIGYEIGQANCIRRLGDIGFLLEKFDEAWGKFNIALNIYRRISERLGESACVRAFGDILFAQGKYDKVRPYYEESMTICQEIGNKVGEAFCLLGFGNLSAVSGDLSKAESEYQAAQLLYERIGYQLGSAHVTSMQSQLFVQQDKLVQAEKFLAQALIVYAGVGNSYWIAIQQRNFARCLKKHGHSDRAKTYQQQSQSLLSQIKLSELADLNT